MKITIGTTYYNCPDLLNLFIKNHIDAVDEMIIIDDGSQIYPAANFIDKTPKLKLYRVTRDYGFNSHGCRNLILKQSSNDWVILIDIDRQIKDVEQSIQSIKNRKIIYNRLYKFVALRYHNNIPQGVHISVNDFLVNRNYFFSAGGYDEELMGLRMGDREYFKQLEHFGKEHVLYDIELILLRRSSLVINNDKIVSPHDLKIKDYDRSKWKELMSLIEQRTKTPDPNKPILTFDWERVF